MDDKVPDETQVETPQIVITLQQDGNIHIGFTENISVVQLYAASALLNRAASKMLDGAEAAQAEAMRRIATVDKPPIILPGRN